MKYLLLGEYGSKVYESKDWVDVCYYVEEHYPEVMAIIKIPDEVEE